MGACAAAPSPAVEAPFVGAGILPYCVVEGRVLVLLGFDSDKGAWTDFGGGPEKVASLAARQPRWETQQQTALREAAEETRAMVGRRQLEAGLDPQRFFDHLTLSYRIFTVRIDYIPPEDFDQALVPSGPRWDPWREKSDFYWIDLALLKTQVKSAANRQGALLNAAPGGAKPLFEFLYDSLAAEFGRGAEAKLFPLD